MKSRVLKHFVLLILLFNIAGCKKTNTDILYDRNYIDEIKAARRDAAFYRIQNFIPGLNVAIAKQGKIIYSEGFGRASEDLGVPATRSTKFRIGQISEVFTALIYHLLIEDGILHPDSTVQTYYPDFPEKAFRLPVRHLVQHTSGIREPGNAEENSSGINVSIKKGIDNFISDTLVVPPGTFQLPSMFNYNLLGAIMEESTGLSFNDILKKYVTDTLGLENTVIDNPFPFIKDRSDCFDYNFIAQVVHATFFDMRYRAPSEGLLSTAEDLVKFGNALLYSDYLSENIKATLFEPVVLDNKMEAQMTNGWIILNDNPGHRVYGKNGNITGGSAALLIFPDEELVVACAANLPTASTDLPVFHMASHFLQDVDPEQ